MSTFVEVNDKSSVADFRARIELDDVVLNKHLNALVEHTIYVREAGKRLHVPPEQLRIHDQSKFSYDEFVAYADHFHGDDPDPNSFVDAWLHHIHHNPHHWQHWMFPDGYTPKNSSVENGIVAMPGYYATEMVADWMGASMAYTGSWDMTDWLRKNWSLIKLHSATRTYIRDILVWECGYSMELLDD